MPACAPDPDNPDLRHTLRGSARGPALRARRLAATLGLGANGDDATDPPRMTGRSHVVVLVAAVIVVLSEVGDNEAV